MAAVSREAPGPCADNQDHWPLDAWDVGSFKLRFIDSFGSTRQGTMRFKQLARMLYCTSATVRREGRAVCRYGGRGVRDHSGPGADITQEQVARLLAQAVGELHDVPILQPAKRCLTVSIERSQPTRDRKGRPENLINPRGQSPLPARPLGAIRAFMFCDKRNPPDNLLTRIAETA